MNVDVKTRKELSALSLEVFGSSSRWQKLITKGYEEVETHMVTETVPGEKEGDPETTVENRVPVTLGNNSYKQTTKYQTLETVKEYLLEQKARLDEIRAKIKQMQEEAAAKKKAQEEALAALSDAQGSAT